VDIFSSLLNVHKSAQLSRCVAVYSRHFVRHVTHQRPRRRRRRRRVYFGPFRNNPENNAVDQIVTRPFQNAPRLLDILRRRNNRVARRAVTGGARKKASIANCADII